MRWSRFVSRSFLALAALALAAAPAAATTLMRQGLESLVRENDTVLQGRVVDIHSYWNADHSFILTDVRVRPTQTFKGLAGGAQDVTITLPGGMVGDITTLIVGGPVLVPGSDYLLFLNREDLPGAAQALTVRDLTQGVFESAMVGGQRRFFSQAIGQPLVPDAMGRTEVPGGEKGFAAADMVQQIRRILDEQ